VIGLILFRTKSLVCKDALHRDSTIQKYFRDSALVTSQNNRFPVNRPNDRAIPSGLLSVHCSICPDDMACRPEARQIKHHPSRRCVISVRTLHCIEKLLFQFSSVRTYQQPVRTPLSIRPSFRFFPFSVMGRLMQPSGQRVFSRPDALLLKVRIAIQIQPSGSQSAIVRTRVQQIWKLRIRLQSSGRQPFMVRMRA
jgi:hypothetical protein